MVTRNRFFSMRFVLFISSVLLIGATAEDRVKQDTKALEYSAEIVWVLEKPISNGKADDLKLNVEKALYSVTRDFAKVKWGLVVYQNQPQKSYCYFKLQALTESKTQFEDQLKPVDLSAAGYSTSSMALMALSLAAEDPGLGWTPTPSQAGDVWSKDIRQVKILFAFPQHLPYIANENEGPELTGSFILDSCLSRAPNPEQVGQILRDKDVALILGVAGRDLAMWNLYARSMNVPHYLFEYNGNEDSTSFDNLARLAVKAVVEIFQVQDKTSTTTVKPKPRPKPASPIQPEVVTQDSTETPPVTLRPRTPKPASDVTAPPSKKGRRAPWHYDETEEESEDEDSEPIDTPSSSMSTTTMGGLVGGGAAAVAAGLGYLFYRRM